MKEVCEKLKLEIKSLIKEESSYLKSISFSIMENSKEFIIYFTWKKDNFDNYFDERDSFRNVVKNLVENNHLYFNKTKSNLAKYTFYWKT